MRQAEHPVIADLCSGSGCIAVALAKHLPESTVYALEYSRTRLTIWNAICAQRGKKCPLPALRRAGNNELRSGPDCIQSPYIKSGVLPQLQREVTFEPLLALDGSSDGLRFYRALAAGYSTAG
jgi:release factor glutamine methyltransferase